MDARFQPLTELQGFRVGQKVRRRSGDIQPVGVIEKLYVGGFQQLGQNYQDRAVIRWQYATRRIGGGTEMHSTIALSKLRPVLAGERVYPYQVKRPVFDDSGHVCSECGARLRLARPARAKEMIGTPAAQFIDYRCPVAEGEWYADDEGKVHRSDDAKHQRISTWQGRQLTQAHKA